MPFMAAPEPRLTRPAMPLAPPSRPRGGWITRSYVAKMANSAPSRLPTTMVWPSPPRNLPGPPESCRYSFFQITSGLMASVTSIGTFFTPLGNGVAESPSSVGRAPAPPLWKLITMKGVGG